MQKPDNELASFGAEAMPGGLAEINDALRAQPDAADRLPASPAKTPLLGLIALAALWIRKVGERR